MKVLVLYDAENQIQEIEEFKQWNLAGQFQFEGYRIKEGSCAINVSPFDLFIVLIGESTKYLNRQFTEDLEKIIATTKPILCLNLNGLVALEENISPRLLHDVGAIHMAFTKEDMEISLAYIKPGTRIDNPTRSYHFRKDQRPFDEE